MKCKLFQIKIEQHKGAIKIFIIKKVSNLNACIRIFFTILFKGKDVNYFVLSEITAWVIHM